MLAAAAYLNEQVAGLGDDFITAVERVVEIAENLPAIGAPLPVGLRRVLVQRFHYAVIYRPGATSIEVLAVAHLRRSPGYWRGRAESPS